MPRRIPPLLFLGAIALLALDVSTAHAGELTFLRAYNGSLSGQTYTTTTLLTADAGSIRFNDGSGQQTFNNTAGTLYYTVNGVPYAEAGLLRARYPNGSVRMDAIAFDGAGGFRLLILGGTYTTGSSYGGSSNGILAALNQYVTETAPDATQTTIQVNGGSTATVPLGSTATVVVTARLASGAVLAGATVSLTGTPTGTSIAPASTTTDANGIATFTVQSSSSGTVSYRGTVTASGSTVQTATTVSVTYTAVPSASLSSATVPAGAAGSTTTILITVRNTDNVAVSGLANRLNVAIGGTNAGAAVSAIVDNGNGTYTVTYVPAAGGTDTVAITLDGTPIGGSPYPSPVAAAVSVAAGGSLLSGTNLTRIADGTSAATITVQLRDAQGANLARAGIAVTFATTRGALSSTAPVTTNSSGVATVMLTSTTTGTAEVTASIADVGPVTNGSPVTVTFTPGPASLSTSTLTAAPASITADGTSTSAVTVQLKDAHGNNLTASGGPIALSSTLGTLGSVTDHDTGTYTATLTSATTVGTATITGLLGGSPLAAKTAVNFTPGAASAATSTITAGPTTITANGTSTSTITVQLKDAHGNDLGASGGAVTLSTTRGTLGAVADHGNGTYTATLTSSTTAGVATITGTLQYTPLADEATVTFAVGAASPATSTITASPTSITADGTSTSTITVQLKDAHGNNLGASGGTVVLAATRGTLGAVTDNNNGTYTATLTAATATGEASVTGTLESAPLAAKAFVTFTAGAASLATSTITASPTTITANGTSTSTITVQLKDAHGNNLGASGGTVTLGTTRGTVGTVTDNGDGTYSATLTSSANAGTATVTGTLGGGAIADTAAVDFTAGAISVAAGGSLLSGADLTRVADGSSAATIAVQLKDAFGNNLSEAGVAVTFATTRGTLSSTSPVLTNASGVATVTLTSTEAGPASVTASIAGGGLGAVTNGSPVAVTFTAGAISVAAGGSLLSGTNLIRVADGTSAATISVQLKDAFGNNLSEAGVAVTFATTHGTLSSTNPVLTNSSGIATVTLTATQTGSASVIASISGSGLGAVTNGSPVAVTFSAGAISVAAGGSLLAGTDLTRIADGTSAATLTVQLKDALGNNITEAGVAVTFATTRGTLSSTAPVLTNSSGIATVTLTSTQTGSASVTASIAGSGLGAVTSGSPVTVTFTPGAASTATTTITASPTTITADGTSTSAITVQLKDAQGNNLTASGGTVTLAATRGTLGPVTDKGDGTYTATLTSSTTIGGATVTGTLAAAALAHDATVLFTVGGASTTTSTVTAGPTTITADGTSTSAITVQLKDAHGNSLTASGGTVALATTRGTLGPVTDHGDGTYSATLTSSTTVGTAAVTGTLDSAAIANDAAVAFVAGPASPATSTITASPTTITANGASTSTMTVQVKDAHGNNLTASGGTVTLATTLGTLGSVTDHGNGTYTATLTSPVTVGAATISGTVASAPMTTTAAVAFTTGAASPARSTVTASQTTVAADGTSTSTITVQLRDAQGNNLTASGGTVTLATTLGTLGPVTDNGDGTYTATLTAPTTIGGAAVTATLGGTTISSTATVTFISGAPSTTTSTMTPNPAAIIADGSSTSTITIQLKDAQGNNLTTSGGTIVVSTTHGSAGAVTDNGNGTYTVVLTAASTEGTATITATLNSSALAAKATVTMGTRTSLTLTKTASSTTIARGGQGSFVLTVRNNGSMATDGTTVTVIDTVPVGLTPTAATGTGWGPGTNSCGIVDRTVTCTRAGALAAGASFEPITVTVNVAADAPTPLVNTATVSGGGATAGSGSVSFETALAPDLTVTTTETGPATRGQASTSIIQVTNSGGLPTSDPVSVVITLPAGVTAAALGGNGWTCEVATLTCTRPDALPAGGSYPGISLTVVIPVDAGDSLSTRIAVKGGGETNTANNTVSGVSPVATPAGSPDLTIAKSHSGTFARGDQGVYALAVRNVGSAASSGPVTVVDSVPTGLVPQGAAGAGWSCAVSGQTVTCTRGDALAAGAAFPAIALTVSVDALAPGAVTNTATVSGGGDASAANNAASDHTAIGGELPSPDLELTIREAADFVQGGTGEILVDLRNRGTGDTTAPATVTITVPEPLEAFSAAGAGWACSRAGNTVTCSRSDRLQPGSVFPSIAIGVRVPLDAPLGVETKASASGGGAGMQSASRRAVITRAPHDLSIGVTHSGIFLRGQRELPYTILVSNAGAGPTWEPVMVVTTVPEGLVPTGVSGTGWSCGVAGEIVTCSRNDELAPGAEYPAIALIVSVAANAPGEVTTVATVSGGGADLDASNNTARSATTVATFETRSVELGLQKRAERSTLRIGDTVWFEIDVDNLGGSRLDQVTLRDILPHGFQFVPGTAQVLRTAGSTAESRASRQPATTPMTLAAMASGNAAPPAAAKWESHDPQGAGAGLTFDIGHMQTGSGISVRYEAQVTPLATPGAHVTRVTASSAGPAGERVTSLPVELAVLVDGHSFSSNRVLIGRVFDDANGNGVFDAGERGVSGVRVLLATGQSVTTDSRGMYSFPVLGAGTTALAVDPSTVPGGYTLPRGNTLQEGPSRLMRTPLGGFGMLRQNFPLIRVRAASDADPAAPAQQAPATSPATGDPLVQTSAGPAHRSPGAGEAARPGVPAAGIVPWDRAGAMQAPQVSAFDIQPERSVLSADGRDRTEVRIRALDASRVPVVGGYVTLTTTAGYLWVPRDRVATPDTAINGLEAPSWQATGRLARPPAVARGEASGGVCSFVEPEPGAEASDLYRRTSIDLSQGDRVCLVADINPGVAILRAQQGAAGDAAGEAVVQFTVPARAPMLVAIGEVTVSQHRAERANDSAPGRVQRMGSVFFQDSFGETGRVTLAATSTPSINSATGSERMFQRDPLDRIYPVLGDGSTRLELAQSNSRVYARVDLGQSHVMFGDIRGDVSDGRSRLIDFQRSLTGVRAHLANGGHGWMSLVVSSPDTAFSRDVFPGTAGAYLRLNRGPVVLGSEIVTIQVRDRRNPERVLSEEPLVRSADYHLDPLTGVVYLLRPLPALTSALDLVQVVVTYEARANGPGSDVVLARANQRIDALGLDIRASALRQAVGLGGLTVGGVELNQRLPASGQLRVELPVSRTSAGASGAPDQTGFATRIDLSQPLGYPGAVLRGRFARTDREFDNPYGQQIVPGQTSGEAGVELTPFAGSQLRAVVGHESNQTAIVDNSRTTAGGEWAQRLGEQLRLSGAFTARRLTDDLTHRRISSQMASAGAEWRFKSRFEAQVRREQNLGNEADPTYPTQTVLGGKYQVTRLHSIFATQRISDAPILPTSDTTSAGIFTPLTTRELAVGIESRVAQHTSVLSRYRREGGRDTTDAFAVIGVLSRLPVTRMLSVDGGFDHAHHLEGTGRSYSSASSGLTFMPHEEMRASWFYQLRMREERQHVLWTGVTGRMLPWLTGLGQYRWLRTEGRTAAEGDQLLGALAVRPVESDRAGLLLSYEHGDFENLQLSGAGRRRTGRLSTDAFYQPATRIELYTRLARIDAPGFDGLAAERTYLWQGRAQYRLFSRVDVAGETRHLSRVRGAGTWVAAGETGIWISRDLRIGLGYSNRPMLEPGQAVTIASGRAGGYVVFSTRLASLFDLGERFGGR